MEETYVLKLYVTGRTERSTRAAEDVRALCDSELAGRFELEVIDVLEHPRIAEDEGVMATPALVKERPEPGARVVGAFNDSGKVLEALGIGPGRRVLVE